MLVKYADVTDPLYVTTDEFSEKSLSYKCRYVYAVILITRIRYYIGWKLCQGSVDLCGLSYDEVYDENDKSINYTFDRIDVCNLRVMEFSINPQTKIQYWNRSVHLWLKYHLYIRMINTSFFKRRVGIASMLTFLTSALWHGFYLSYYMFFFHLFLVEQITNYLNSNHNFFDKVDKSNIFIRFIVWCCVMATLIYCALAFTLLQPENIFKYYKAFNFVPNGILLTGFILVKILGMFVKKEKKIIKKNLEVEEDIKKTN